MGLTFKRTFYFGFRLKAIFEIYSWDDFKADDF
jgi:hypothetical protein